MNKLKMTLKWRFTLLSILLIVLSSVAITIAINIDVGKSVPRTPEHIIGETEEFYISLDFDQILQENPQFKPILENGDIFISPSQFEMVMTTAVSNIYTTSLITLLTILVLGGISAYWIADRALSPIKKLNENIKSINENNLLVHLDIEGPHDEIKELTYSFNQMLDKLNHAFSSQKRFNANVAHELKTPLTVMKTNIDVLNEYEEKTIDMYEETMDIVRESICRLNSMIESMLDLVRQESAPLDDEVDLNQIVEDVVEDLRVIAEQKQITLVEQTFIPQSLIKGNEILLYRAIYNVVENGIKYNKPYGYVHIQGIQIKNHIEIQIQDTGKGMEEEELEHIFEPFYRTSELSMHAESGLGLGLCLTQSIVTIHGGTIQVHTNKNKGTTFIITFPI